MTFTVSLLRRRWIALLGVVLWLHSAGAQETNGVYPIDLPAALRLAGAQNLDVQIAQERLKQARAEHSSAIEQFFPWISPGVAYHRRDGSSQFFPTGIVTNDAHLESYAPGATLVAQTSFGDAIYNSLAAKQLVKANSQALEAQRQVSLLAAAQGYFGLAKAKAIADVTREALATSQDYQKQLHSAVDLGIAFRGDELRVQTQTGNYEITLSQAAEQQRIAAANLAQVLHLDPAVELVPVDDTMVRVTLIETNAALSALVQRALQYRPELKQNDALVLAARESKNGAVYGPLIPSFNAQVFAGGFGGGPLDGHGSFGGAQDYQFALGWRIGPGGLLDSGRVHASRALLATTQLENAKIKDAIVSEVVAAFTRVNAAATQIDVAGNNLKAATETLRLTRERKQFGVGAVLEDIQAQEALTQTRSQYVTAVAEFNTAQYELNKAVGGLSETQTK